MNSSDNRKLEKKEQTLENLSRPLKRHIISFLVGDKIINKSDKTNFPAGSFFFNLNTSYAVLAAQTIYNLVHRIEVNNTLTFIIQNPEILFIPFPIEIKDRHGQRIKGKPLQILAAADEFDHIKLKWGAKPKSLVALLRTCFKNPKDFDSQIQEQFRGVRTELQMARYVVGIKTFIEYVIESPDYPEDTPFETLVTIPYVKICRNIFLDKLKPDPDKIITSGLAWDCWHIFHVFQTIFMENVSALGGMFSVKSKLVMGVVYPALMARSQFSHLEIIMNDIHQTISAGKSPDHYDNVPEFLKDIGTTDSLVSQGAAYIELMKRLLEDYHHMVSISLSLPEKPVWPILKVRFASLLLNRNNNIEQLKSPENSSQSCCRIM